MVWKIFSRSGRHKSGNPQSSIKVGIILGFGVFLLLLFFITPIIRRKISNKALRKNARKNKRWIFRIWAFFSSSRLVSHGIGSVSQYAPVDVCDGNSFSCMAHLEDISLLFNSETNYASRSEKIGKRKKKKIPLR